MVNLEEEEKIETLSPTVISPVHSLGQKIPEIDPIQQEIYD